MWSLLPSSQSPAFSPILSEMNTGYTAPTFHENQVLYYPPIYDHVSFQRIYQTPKPRGIFPNTSLQWEVVAKQEDGSLSVLRDFLFTLFLKARSMYGGRPPHRRPEDAPCCGDRELTCALSKCALLKEWWMNLLNYRTYDNLLFIYVFEIIDPIFLPYLRNWVITRTFCTNFTQISWKSLENRTKLSKVYFNYDFYHIHSF